MLDVTTVTDGLGLTVSDNTDLGSVLGRTVRVGVSLTMIAAASFLMTGCVKASESDCDVAYDHMLKLSAQGHPEIVAKVQKADQEKRRPKFLTACVGKTSIKVIKCWLAAKTSAELHLCERND